MDYCIAALQAEAKKTVLDTTYEKPINKALNNTQTLDQSSQVEETPEYLHLIPSVDVSPSLLYIVLLIVILLMLIRVEI